VAIAAGTPRGLWLWCGARLGDLLCLLQVYRRTVRRNMEFVGLWSAEEQRRITRQLYRNVGRYAAECLRPTGTPPPALIEGDGALRGPQGGIVLFAHLGNWEVLPALLRRVGRTVAVIAKPMENPLVERWVQRQRQRDGVSFTAPEAALRHCLRVIRGSGLVALAIDQYPGRRGTLSTFLGKATRTVRTSAGLAVHTGCPVVGVYALLGADGVYRVSVQAVPALAAAVPPGTDPVTETLQAHSAVVSAWVTAHPEHWFGWFHRRFRHAVEY
jgi:KDO2-lipid IV(A) lauroyltransferase